MTSSSTSPRRLHGSSPTPATKSAPRAAAPTLSRLNHSSLSIETGSAPSSTSLVVDPATLDTAATTASEVSGTAAVTGSIRLVPHVEFSSRMSLHFEPMERQISSNHVIKIGRFNEKSSNRMSMTFKSKVVSRAHAEVWCENGTWFIRDTKSSSGTFVNHIRLSPPGNESKRTILVDGDAIQFGIDFRGGTKEDYRCVRTKVELNRVISAKSNKFNETAHKKLKSLTAYNNRRGSLDDSASTYSAECCICLFAIAPAQALFVAPCSHAYHFKCIRPHINQHYPNFLCGVCRKYSDLEASVEVESEAWLDSQASGDPWTPISERDEPLYRPLQSVLSQETTPQRPKEAGSSPESPVNAVVADQVADQDQSGPDRCSRRGSAPINMVNRRLHELTLENQDTPRNDAGPYLINGAPS